MNVSKLTLTLAKNYPLTTPSEVVFPGMTEVLRLTAPSYRLPDQALDIATIILNDL